MESDNFRDQISASMRLLAPQLGDASLLVDECLESARKSFSEAFILSLSPHVWARVTLIYHKHFLDTGSDVSVGEMLAEVMRDAISTSRIDFLTQSLAVKRRYEKEHGKDPDTSLHLVKK